MFVPIAYWMIRFRGTAAAFFFFYLVFFMCAAVSYPEPLPCSALVVSLCAEQEVSACQLVHIAELVHM